MAESEIVKKDLLEAWSRTGLRTLMIFIPIVLVVIVPVIFLVAISLIPIDTVGMLPEGISGFTQVGIDLLPGEIAYSLIPEKISAMISTSGLSEDYRQDMFFAFTTLLCPMFFLSVPVLCATSAASSAFIAERENGTLESLMLSSMDRKSIFNAKISGCVIFSVLVSLVSFIAFTITVAVGAIILSCSFFFNFDWFIIIVLLMPAISIFCVVFVSLLSIRIKSMGESLQLSGYFILFIALIYLAQFSGLFQINVFVLILFAVLILVADFIMFNKASKNYTAEKQLTGNFLRSRKMHN